MTKSDTHLEISKPKRKLPRSDKCIKIRSDPWNLLERMRDDFEDLLREKGDQTPDHRLGNIDDFIANHVRKKRVDHPKDLDIFEIEYVRDIDQRADEREQQQDNQRKHKSKKKKTAKTSKSTTSKRLNGAERSKNSKEIKNKSRKSKNKSSKNKNKPRKALRRKDSKNKKNVNILPVLPATTLPSRPSRSHGQSSNTRKRKLRSKKATYKIEENLSYDKSE